MNRADKLKALQDPSYASHMALMEIMGRVQTMRGDAGYTPIKGVDYFTHEEVMAMANYIRSLVPDGVTPVKGVDYFDGAPGDAGTPGNHGITPTKGVDYFTRTERDAMIAEVTKGIKIKDGVSPKIEDIVAATIPVLREQFKYENIKNAPDLKDLTELIAFLKRGGFRGGGSSSATGAIAKSSDLSSQCNGSNLIFTIPTFTTILSLVGSDAPIVYRPSIDFTAAGTTLTLSVVNAPSAGSTLILTYV